MEQMGPQPTNLPPQEENLWHIDNITQTTLFTSTGTEPGKKVHFYVMGTGPFELDVPDKQFNANTINELVHKMAVDIVNALALKGPNINNTFQPQQYFTPETG